MPLRSVLLAHEKTRSAFAVRASWKNFDSAVHQQELDLLLVASLKLINLSLQLSQLRRNSGDALGLLLLRLQRQQTSDLSGNLPLALLLKRSGVGAVIRNLLLREFDA